MIDSDVIGMMMSDDGLSVTVVTVPSEALNEIIEVFPTLEEKNFVAAVDRGLLEEIVRLSDDGAEAVMERVGMVIGKLTEEVAPVDTRWIYEQA